MKAARALLFDNDNDVDKLKEAEPWLFEAGDKHAKDGSAGFGTTGLPSVGAASDEVYQRASVPGCLNSGRRMVRARHNAKEIPILKISVTGLGDCTRNVGYNTDAITYEFETKTFNYNRGIRLFADVDWSLVNVRARSMLAASRYGRA